MNELQKALQNKASNADLDFYLEIETTQRIREHIEEIIRESSCSTRDGAKLFAIREILESNTP